MEALFVSFGSMNLFGGRKFVHDIHENPNSSLADKFIQTPQFVYFDGLLPHPLKERLYEVFLTT
jgi:hypothetical protein